MPDISTAAGLGQMIGMGFGLLLILTLRARRYGTNVARTYIPIWLAACIGFAIYSIVDRGIDWQIFIMPLLANFAVPSLVALFLARRMRR
ncbi:MAG: hypothetical protein ABL874_05715 [Sphingopyxis sp.]